MEMTESSEECLLHVDHTVISDWIWLSVGMIDCVAAVGAVCYVI
jgi:hypothetical protein